MKKSKASQPHAARQPRVQEAIAFPSKLTVAQQMAARLLDRSPRERSLRSDAYMPTRDHLDELLSGKLSDAGREEIADWPGWVSHFHGAMAMFEELARLALYDQRERAPQLNGISIISRLAKIARLTATVYAAYAAAQQENSEDALGLGVDESLPATFELARRYREYTLYIESLLLDTWPNLSPEVLSQPYQESADAAA